MRKAAKAVPPKTDSGARKPAAPGAALDDDRKEAAIEQQRLWRDSPSETAAMTDMPDPDKSDKRKPEKAAMPTARAGR